MTLSRMNRRDALLAALSLGTGMALSRTALSAGSGADLDQGDPSSGQKLPVIGIGTNKYDVTAAGDIAPLRAVLEQLPMQGGAMVDTARFTARPKESSAGWLRNCATGSGCSWPRRS